MSTENTIITKYRPKSFERIIGHDEKIGQLQRRIQSDTRPHGYLLTGPAGTGKTTIARIIAAEVDAEVLEIDAASHSSVDEMRTVVQHGQHMSLTGRANRLFLIDECHRLSANAWDVLLKPLEEPPAHLYFALCTTAPHKVIDTIKSRCYHVQLDPVPYETLCEFLDIICDQEEWKVIDDVLTTIAQKANGSPRFALNFLEAAHEAKSREEAERIIGLSEQSDDVLRLCKLVIDRKDWRIVAEALRKLDGADFDQVNAFVTRFTMSAIIRAKEEKEAKRCWELLDALLYPASTYDRKAQLYAAIGRWYWSDWS